MNITAIHNEQNLQPLIQLKNINVVFAQKTALQNINLNIYPNSIITIVGPNGGGKSTLLKTLLKLQTPTSGEVIYSKNVRIGYVPQKIHLDHSLPITVERFLSLKKGLKTQEISTALEQLSISHLRKSNMQKLSGGEMQRVLLARAILNKPNLLVLDEPTQGVDITGQTTVNFTDDNFSVQLPDLSANEGIRINYSVQLPYAPSDGENFLNAATLTTTNGVEDSRNSTYTYYLGHGEAEGYTYKIQIKKN